MDNINDLIANLTPDDINMLKGVAESILSTNGNENTAPPPRKAQTPAQGAPKQNAQQLQPGGALAGIGSDEINMMLRAKSIFEKMNNASNKNTDLIMALKPHLSPETRGRADTAIKILKLFDILPYLKELF